MRISALRYAPNSARRFRPAILLACLLLACGDDGSEDTSTTGASDLSGGPRLEIVPTASDDTGGGDASIEGVVSITEGCPLLEVAGDGLAAVQFPSGTELLDDGITVRLGGGRTFAFVPGESLSLPGGVGTADRGLALGSEDLATCLERSGATSVIFVSGEDG